MADETKPRFLARRRRPLLKEDSYAKPHGNDRKPRSNKEKSNLKTKLFEKRGFRDVSTTAKPRAKGFGICGGGRHDQGGKQSHSGRISRKADA